MNVPPEFLTLYDWIEANQQFVDYEHGRVGFLFPEDELKRGWTKTQRIVHMESGSGSMLCCELADSPIDFLNYKVARRRPLNRSVRRQAFKSWR